MTCPPNVLRLHFSPSPTGYVLFSSCICYKLYAHNFYPRISSDHLRNFSDKLLCAHWCLPCTHCRCLSAHCNYLFAHSKPKLADTKIHRSFVTMTLFSCVIMGEYPVFEKIIRKWWLPFAHWHSPFAHWHSSLLTDCSRIHMTIRAKSGKGASIGDPNPRIVM